MKNKMKKIISGVLSAALVGPAFPAALTASAAAPEIYVAPNGSDSGAGTAASPFKTLNRARDEVRKYNSDMSGDIIVNVAAGTYYMDEALTLTPEDSGSNGHNVIYRGIPSQSGEKPVFSGGTDISDGWEIYDADAGIYKREGVDWEFRQLYTNNDRAIRARVPNLDNKETNGPYFRATGGNGQYPLFIGYNNEYAKNAGNYGEVIWESSWSQFHARIDSYNPSTGRLTFKSPDKTFAWNHHTQGDTPFYLENSLAYLDAEGEWYLDPDADTLYYKPRTGEVMNETQIIAPRLETMVSFEGKNENDRVKNITIDGIRFLHSNWLAPNEYGYCSVQGGFRYQTEGGESNSEIRGSSRYDAPKSMVQLKYTDSISLTNSEFSFSGSWGIMGYEGTKNTLIDRNTFVKNAGGGVTMGMAGREWDDQDSSGNPRAYTDMDGQSVGDTITNNYIDHVACEYQDMVGIGAMLPQNMTIANNEIGYLPYTGINIGWNWLDTDHGMTGNRVYQNYIHDTCLLLQDGGGIYSLGRMDGDSIFYYNYITNISMSEWAPWNNLMGIYFDNGSCYKKAQANVFDNTEYAFQASNAPNHDNIFEGNYYNCPGGISSTGSSAVIGNIPFTSDNVPAEAQKIIDHAGIDKEPLPDPSSRVNLAFHKPITSSEDDDVFPAEYAVDGDASTLWEQQVQNRPDSSKAETSLTLDLEAEYSIDEIMINFQYGNRSKYKIEYSSDGSVWKEYANRLNRDPLPSASVYESKPGIKAQYLKISMNTDGWGAGVYEIYVYGDNSGASASAEISPEKAEYDKNPLWKQEVKITALENGSHISAIKNGDYTLVPGKDYEKHWNNITLSESYLDTLPTGDSILTVEFDKSESKEFTVTVTEDDGGSNLALKKPIEASSYNTNENRYASYMVDGDMSTRWAQYQGTNGQPATIVIDLEDTYLITKTSIAFELDSAGYNYKIECSTNGDVWTTFVDKMGQASPTATVIDSGSAPARYIRLTVNHNDWGASIWEFQVKGTPYHIDRELVNLARGKKITASSQETENEYHPAEHAVDGDMQTRWAQKMNTANVHNTLDIDLGAVYDVCSINTHFELGPEMTTGYNYKIEYSEDGSEYKTYVDKLNEYTPAKDVTDDKEVKARYFRYEVNNKEWGASIYEIEILGYDESSPSGGISEGTYTLRDASNKYISGGADVSLTDELSGGAEERWIEEYADGTYFRLINSSTGEALTYNVGTKNALTAPVSYGDMTQLWQYVDNTDGKGASMLMNKACGLVLQINAGESSANGCALGMYQFEGWIRNHFSWRREALSDGTVMLKNECGTYLSANGNGAQALTWERTPGNSLKWEIAAAADGTYTITNASSGKRAAVSGGKLILADADDSALNQRWSVTQSGSLLSRFYVFTNAESGTALNVGGSSEWVCAAAGAGLDAIAYITDITTSGTDKITVNYKYHSDKSEGASKYAVYAFDSRDAKPEKAFSEGECKSGFTFDAGGIDASKTLLITISPETEDGDKGAAAAKYILPVVTQQTLSASVAYEGGFADAEDDIKNNRNGWFGVGPAETLFGTLSGHPSALGFKSLEWWGESRLSVDFTDSANEYPSVSGKAYVEYDMYFDTVDNHDRESQAAIGLMCGNNMFGTIQQRGDRITLAAGGGRNIAKLYPIGDQKNVVHRWINVKYYVDTDRNKFAVALDDKFMISDDGSIWFTPTFFDVPHSDGTANVTAVTGIMIKHWWGSQNSAIHIDSMKLGVYSDSGLAPWSVYSAEPENGTLTYGTENEITVGIRENETGFTGNAYIGLYDSDGTLRAASVKNDIAFDTRGVSVNKMPLNVPSESGKYTIKVFLWDNSQSPLSDAYARSYSVESPFKMTNVFGDNMVLQADMPISVFGTGIPGETVTAAIGDNTASGTVDESGNWQFFLDAMDAGTGYSLTVKSGNESLEFSNVAIGDVFILAGQSNMEYWMSGFGDSRADLENNRDKTNNPEIRIVELLNLDRNYEATSPRENLPDGAIWGEMNFDRAWLASQIGYYAAQQLNEETGRPIGLIRRLGSVALAPGRRFIQ